MNADSLWVKMCGVTRAEDAHCAQRAGVDAVGLVFVPKSPRSLSLEHAKALDQAMDQGIERVGLFMDASPDWIEAVLAAVKLDRLQFHGHESPADCERFGRAYIKALGFGDIASGVGEDQAARRDPWLDHARQYASADALLIDSHGSGQMGGSGETSDWQALAHTVEALDRPWVLAGGLRPDNVGHALGHLHPAGIDFSSGVETQPGIKDHGKIQQLMSTLDAVSSSKETTRDHG